jgi:hypothetical protein
MYQVALEVSAHTHKCYRAVDTVSAATWNVSRRLILLLNAMKPLIILTKMQKERHTFLKNMRIFPTFPYESNTEETSLHSNYGLPCTVQDILTPDPFQFIIHIIIIIITWRYSPT